MAINPNMSMIIAGPGLSIRVLEEVTEPQLKIARKADAVITKEIRSANSYRKISQTFTANKSRWCPGRPDSLRAMHSPTGCRNDRIHDCDCLPFRA